MNASTQQKGEQFLHAGTLASLTLLLLSSKEREDLQLWVVSPRLFSMHDSQAWCQTLHRARLAARAGRTGCNAGCMVWKDLTCRLVSRRKPKANHHPISHPQGRVLLTPGYGLWLDAGGWGGLALLGRGLWAVGTCCLRFLAGAQTINKSFQPVTSMLNPLKAVLLWAH